jgi:S-DNA-T family DNA segregation ATPase FtsK/SpoIIIE
MLGVEVGLLFSQFFGFTGGTLLLLALFAAGLSLFTGLSWLKLIERLGALLELAWLGSILLYQRWQDRRIGREVAREREAEVEIERKRIEEFHVEPIRIEPAEVVIPKSPRREKERQAPLFHDMPGGALPPLHLLEEPSHDVEPPSPETLEFTSRLIERKLADFGVQVKVLAAYPGPVITRYEIEPAVGVKGAQIVNLVKDIARALSVVSVRVVETIPGKSCMGLELPNPKRQTVRLSEILGSKAYHDMHSPLTLTLGKDISGAPMVVDLAKMPHLLVAGTTGSGKSVGINAMILSLVYKSEPSDVRLILVDPKMLELSIYEGIPHLLAPVVTDMKQAANALQWCVVEMDRRYRLMSALGVRNLAGFNGKIKDAIKAGAPIPNPFSLTPESPEPLPALPYVVVIIDELADLMMVAGKKVEELIARLAQKARAAGIHLVLATQRPSVDVITGLIKANIPTRISFQVSSKVDSRTILDQMGAEALLGQGDMLYLAPGSGVPVRVHGAFVADSEVHAVVDYLKKTGQPEYVDGILDAPGGEEGEGPGGEGGGPDGEADPLYDQAVEVVLKTRRPSISLVQRHLRIGYNRAARLIEQMERSGLVSPMGANGNREVIVPAREG